MNTVYVLLDYCNIYPQGLEGEAAHTHEINRLVDLALTLDSNASRVELRLYGGWLQDGVLSPEASTIQSHLGGLQRFPMPHPRQARRLLHGDVALATSLAIAPGLEFNRTLQGRRGLPRLRLDHAALPDVCRESPDQCPVRILHRFARKKGKLCGVAGCTVSNAEAFIRREQKMVDTLLACDAVDVSRAPSVSTVAVVTDDTDLIPALVVVARTTPTRAVFVTSNSELANDHASFLATAGVDVQVWKDRS